MKNIKYKIIAIGDKDIADLMAKLSDMAKDDPDETLKFFFKGKYLCLS